MYCENCGNQLPANAVFCSACGVSVEASVPLRKPYWSETSMALSEQAKVASQDTIQALKVVGINPTGGLLPVYEALQPQRAVGVGIMFALLFDACFLFACNRMVNSLFALNSWVSEARYVLGWHPDWFKIFLLGLLPFVSLAVAMMVARMVFRGTGRVEGDILIAGLSLLPLGITLAVSSILISPANAEVIAALIFFAFCYTIMILHTGCVRIARMPEAGAALAVPVILLLSAWLLKVALVSLI